MFNFMYIFEISYLEFIKKLQFQKNTPYYLSIYLQLGKKRIEQNAILEVKLP